MGSTGAGTGRGGGGAAAGGTAPIQMGGIRSGQRASARYMRNANAAGRTGAVSTEEFIRATGVNPRTGRRVRRRP